MDKHTDRQTDRQTDRPTDRQTDTNIFLAQTLFLHVFEHFKTIKPIKIYQNFFRDTVLPHHVMWK